MTPRLILPNTSSTCALNCCGLSESLAILCTQSTISSLAPGQYSLSRPGKYGASAACHNRVYHCSVW